MKTNLRVWHTAIFIKGKQCSAIVAARSRAEAGRLLNLPDRQMREYASITSNAESIVTATAKPFTVFVNQNGMNYPNVWVELEKN